MSFDVLPMQEDDCAAVEHLRVATWKVSYRGLVDDDLLDRLQPDVDRRAESWRFLNERGDSVQLVARRHDDVVGWAAAGPARADADNLELYALYVDASLQRSGVGRALVNEAFAHLAPPPDQQVVVWTLEASEQARRFYVSVGFALDGQHDTIDVQVDGRAYPTHRVRLSQRGWVDRP